MKDAFDLSIPLAYVTRKQKKIILERVYIYETATSFFFLIYCIQLYKITEKRMWEKFNLYNDIKSSCIPKL